jgi:hypothetical protein
METLESLLPMMLLAQGVMGGVDTLLNHEIIERLPYRPKARREIGLHAIREAIYATLFGGLAWFQWHGTAALAIAALLVAEVLVTASDEFIENRTRVLPQNERVLHVFLTLNLGLIIAVTVPILSEWVTRPDGLVRTDHGVVSWVLSVLAAFAAAWSLRDLLAFRRLGHARFSSFE